MLLNIYDFTRCKINLILNIIRRKHLIYLIRYFTPRIYLKFILDKAIRKFDIRSFSQSGKTSCHIFNVLWNEKYFSFKKIMNFMNRQEPFVAQEYKENKEIQPIKFYQILHGRKK